MGMSFSFFMPVGFADILRQLLKASIKKSNRKKLSVAQKERAKFRLFMTSTKREHSFSVVQLSLSGIDISKFE